METNGAQYCTTTTGAIGTGARHIRRHATKESVYRKQNIQKEKMQKNEQCPEAKEEEKEQKIGNLRQRSLEEETQEM